MRKDGVMHKQASYTCPLCHKSFRGALEKVEQRVADHIAKCPVIVTMPDTNARTAKRHELCDAIEIDSQWVDAQADIYVTEHAYKEHPSDETRRAMQDARDGMNRVLTNYLNEPY